MATCSDPYDEGRDDYPFDCSWYPGATAKTSPSEIPCSGDCTLSECCDMPKTCLDSDGDGNNNQFDCSGQPHGLNPYITCAQDACTPEECCIGGCANFDCSPSGGTLKSTYQDIDCVGPYCNSRECCDIPKTCEDINGVGLGRTTQFDCNSYRGTLRSSPQDINCSGDSCDAVECCDIPKTCMDIDGEGIVNPLDCSGQPNSVNPYTTCNSDTCTPVECCTGEPHRDHTCANKCYLQDIYPQCYNDRIDSRDSQHYFDCPSSRLLLETVCEGAQCYPENNIHGDYTTLNPDIGGRTDLCSTIDNQSDCLNTILSYRDVGQGYTAGQDTSSLLDMPHTHRGSCEWVDRGSYMGGAICTSPPWLAVSGNILSAPQYHSIPLWDDIDADCDLSNDNLCTCGHDTDITVPRYDCSLHHPNATLKTTPQDIDCSGASCTLSECCDIPKTCADTDADGVEDPSPFDCSSNTLDLDDNPANITCSGATCTESDCCTKTPATPTCADPEGDGNQYDCVGQPRQVVLPGAS